MDAVSLTIAFVLGFGARQLGLPPLVGYLAAGFLLAQLGVQGGDLLKTVSDLGITLLLFTIGLKLRLSILARPEVWAVTTIHMGAIALTFGGALWLLARWLGPGLLTGTPAEVFTIGFALAFSSTVFAVKVLEERGDMTSRHGRISIGILILQDLFAVGYLVAATGKGPSVFAFGLLALPLARPVFGALMNRCGHGELLVLFGLTAAVGASALFELVDIKGDLGALAVGVLLGSHHKSSELSKALLGFKDIFLIGFFVSIGLLGLPGWQGAGLVLGLTALMLFKAGLLALLLLLFRVRFRTSMMSTLGLMTYSEFGLIVVAIAVDTGVLDAEWIVILALAVSLSLVVASPLNSYSRQLYGWLGSWLRPFERSRVLSEDAPVPFGDARILVCGMGRVGTGAYLELEERYGGVVVGVDRDERKVEEHRSEGREVVQAECTDPDFWEQVVASRVGLILLAMPNHTENLYAAGALSRLGYTGLASATAQFPDEVDELRAAGISAAYNIRAEVGAGLAELASAGFQPDGDDH